MAFKLGLVGLCTSHPGSWVPIIRQMSEERVVDVEVTAAWDSGETRPEGYAEEFCEEHGIPNPVGSLRDMLELVDGVIVHTTNWDRHVEQARPFVEAGKAVLIDKPIVGNMRDAGQLLDWAKMGKRITGGSSLRFAPEITEFLALPVEERGEVHTAFAGCGVDEFNYGIHAYALLSGLLGPGIRSVQYLGASRQKLLRLNWEDGRIGILCIGQAVWMPMYVTAVTPKTVAHVTAGGGQVYRALLEACLPYLMGQTDTPPCETAELLEPEIAALAARASWMNGGREVFLTDVRQDDPGYDGNRFAVEYRRARLG